jgi:SAM-dependent methyltransferase
VSVFGAGYAETYDDVYSEKDYAGECDLLERVFREYADGSVKSVLDLGSGTGSHAFVLAERGYEVVGVDRSEEMLARARAKSDTVEFVHADIASVDLGRTFDAVVILFAVLGYQTDDDALTQTLRTAAAHLRPGGVLAFDVWYGPAVLAAGPSTRFREIDANGRRILRLAEGSLDTDRNLCHVDFRLWELAGDRLVAEARERHTMRFFFADELEARLDEAGFELARLGAFPHFDVDPDEETWNVFVVARA